MKKRFASGFIGVLMMSALGGLTGCNGGGGSEPPSPPPPPPAAAQCTQPDCLKVVRDEARSTDTRGWYNVVNECDGEWNVAYCVAPANSGSPACSSPDRPALFPNETSGAIITRGPEATVIVCGCEVPEVLELSATSPWDGTGTCAKPEE